jgi:hypothetical protein
MYFKLFALMFLVLTSCEKNEDCPKNSNSYIHVINRSKKRIYCNNLTAYTNSSINFNNPSGNEFLTLLPNKGQKFYSWKIRKDNSCWESKLKEFEKIIIFFFDADILEKTPWEEVQKNGTGVLEVREIDLDYLIKNNFEVIYK